MKIDDDALPSVRRPTKKQQKEIDAAQAEMAVRFDASGRRFDRAYAILKELNAFPREDWSPRQFASYVDALIILGEYDTAYELTGDEKFKAIWDGINADNAEFCDCADYESVELVDGKKKSVKHSRLFVKQEIWNVKKGSTSNIMACNVCGRCIVQ